MLVVPLQATPSQTVKVVLGGQNCVLNIYQKPRGLFFDLNADGSDVVTAVLAHDVCALVHRQYFGFEGNFLFVDTQGKSDPDYTGLSSRFSLVYLTAAENAFV